MGLGAAMVFPATLSLISNIFVERAERARAIGLWGATAGIAIALGPIVGGWLLERFSWSSIFFAMTPVAASAALLVGARRPDLARRERAAAGPARLPALERRDGDPDLHDHRGPAARLGAARARSPASPLAAVLLAAFVAWERRTDEPMLDVRLFANPRFTAASGSVTVAFFSLFGFIFLMTQYFQFIKRYGPLSTGVHLLPVATSVGVASVLGTRLAVRFGTKLVVAAGLVMVAAFYALGGAVVAPGDRLRDDRRCRWSLYGIGMGLTSAPATEAIMGVVPRAKAGVGSAVNDTTRLLGGTLGVAMIGSVYASLYSSRLTAAPSRRASPPGSPRSPTARSARRSAWPTASLATGHRRARGRRRPCRLRRVHRRPLPRLPGRRRRRGSRRCDGGAASTGLPLGVRRGARACAGARSPRAGDGARRMTARARDVLAGVGGLSAPAPVPR